MSFNNKIVTNDTFIDCIIDYFCKKINMPMTNIDDILNKEYLDYEDIVILLSIEDKNDMQKVFDKALSVKANAIGRFVYLRGLIELSNICRKNCLYCGIRRDNSKAIRYTLSHDEVMESVRLTEKYGFGSVVIQSGELLGDTFIETLESYIKEIHQNYPELLITLSCGEQTPEVYKRWFDAGAHRYLLRIESSDEELYYSIHPKDENHSFKARMQVLTDLRNTGYQVGTGVMIGLPNQTVEHLAKDLVFFRDFDVDMIGMGPFIEHSETPLYEKRNQLWTLEKRFNVSLLMIAILRIMMPTINIAASTALESLDNQGRRKAILAGANVVMPNVTPLYKKKNYKLYENKPGIHLNPWESLKSIHDSIENCGEHICYHNPGIPKHFRDRTNNT